jgi:hypothetical protein|tara:strand:+ start:1396 stop:1605 length:210 start_codon:yes stop_codon:yes gene_type:complete
MCQNLYCRASIGYDDPTDKPVQKSGKTAEIRPKLNSMLNMIPNLIFPKIKKGKQMLPLLLNLAFSFWYF